MGVLQMSYMHKAGLNKAWLEDRSTNPGNPPLSGLLISLVALLLPALHLISKELVYVPYFWDAVKEAELLKAWMTQLSLKISFVAVTYAFKLNHLKGKLITGSSSSCAPQLLVLHLTARLKGNRAVFQLSLICIDISLAEKGWVSPFIQGCWVT